MERLRDAELKLEGFRTRTITLPSEATIITPGLEQTRDPVFRTYFDKKLESSDLRQFSDALRAR